MSRRRADTVLTPIDKLGFGSLGVTPTDYDWSDGYPEVWSYVQVPDCPDCDTDERVNWIADESEWRCYGKRGDHEWGVEVDMLDSTEGPMMNYYYPVDSWVIRQNGGLHEAAARLKGLPLCLVEWEERDDYALALTGGGMDLSWEICEAYMRLGELPPTHFADLPGYAGRPRGDVDEWVVRGCMRSFAVAHERAAYALDRALEKLGGWLKAEVAS